ncbi:two-component sensor histidine kinase, partial [Schumannella luteola]
MLSPGDLLLVILTAAGCTAGVTLLAFVALRLNRRGTIGVQIRIVVAAVAASITLSTAAIAAEMYFSEHDFQLLLWIV